jgi:hypothetical protein
MPCSRVRSNRITWEQLHCENHTPRLEQESETAAVSQALAAMSTIKLCASLVNPPPPWVLHMSPSFPPLEAETNMLQLKLQIAFLLLPKRSLPTQLGPLRKIQNNIVATYQAYYFTKNGWDLPRSALWSEAYQSGLSHSGCIRSYTRPSSSAINSMSSISLLNSQPARTGTFFKMEPHSDP